MSSFLKNLKAGVPSALLQKRNGLTFLSWAHALSLAGRPEMEPVLFGTHKAPYVTVFDGAAVAVSLPTCVGVPQVVYLPVLGSSNDAISLDKLTARDIGDTLSRCRAKAVAMCRGVGFSLYVGYEGDGEKFLQDLALQPDSDLATAAPFISSRKGGGGQVAYLEWGAALAAALITDPGFSWSIVEFGQTPDGSPLLYSPAGQGYLVGVRVTYKGWVHTEYLPIMGGNLKVLPKPTAADWNKAAMRALAKAIASCTGYGLGIYAKDSVESSVEASQRVKAQEKARPFAGFDTYVEGLAPEDAVLIAKVARALVREPTETKFAGAITYVTTSLAAEKAKVAALRVVEVLREQLLGPQTEDLLQGASGEAAAPAAQGDTASAQSQEAEPSSGTAKPSAKQAASSKRLATSVLASLKKDYTDKRRQDALAYADRSLASGALLAEDHANLVKALAEVLVQALAGTLESEAA